METRIPSPVVPRAQTAERTINDIEAAILLVNSGAARSVRLAGLPGAERLAPTAMVAATHAGIRCAVERTDGGGVVLSFAALGHR